jgi:hypothetical protein
MSVDVNLSLTVDNVKSLEQVEEVKAAIRTVLVAEGIENDVGLGWPERGDHYVVLARTPEPLIISGSYTWCPKVEERFREAVGAVAPDTEITITWSYPETY